LFAGFFLSETRVKEKLVTSRKGNNPDRIFATMVSSKSSTHMQISDGNVD
jgi:hypothetical protein